MDSFDFRHRVGAAGANDTATLPTSARAQSSYRPIPAKTATEFPSFEMPGEAAPTSDAAMSPSLELGFITWNGDALGGFQRLSRPSPEQLGAYVGGLVAGPLILYGGLKGAGSADHPPSLVLGPSSVFDVARLMRVGGRLVGGR